MTIGRPRKVEMDEALKAAMNIYWRKGYEATSLQDLLQETKLCKSSLYQLFGSKQNLFLQSLDLFQSELKQSLLDQLASSSSGKQFIENVFADVIAEASATEQKKGCMLVNSANEFSQTNKPVAELVSKGTDNIKAVFIEAIERDLKSGTLKTSIAVDTLANILLMNICGLRTMVKAGMDQDVLKEVVNTTLEIVE